MAIVVLVVGCDAIDGLGAVVEQGPAPRTVGDYEGSFLREPTGPAPSEPVPPQPHNDLFQGLYETDDRIWPLAATSTGPVEGLDEIGAGRVVWRFGGDTVETTLYSVTGFDPDTVRAARPDDDTLFLFVAPGIDPLPEGLCERFVCVEP